MTYIPIIIVTIAVMAPLYGADEKSLSIDNESVEIFSDKTTSLGITGVHAGGLIGVSLDGKFEFMTNTRTHPFVDIGLGLSGIRYGLGVILLSDPGKKWARIAITGSHDNDKANVGIGARIVIVDRSRRDGDKNTDVFGKSVDDSQYIGAELILVGAGISIIPGVFYNADENQTIGAVSYGFGF